MASNNCCNYHAGMLRQTADIQRRVLSPKDEGGGSPLEWETFAEDVRCAILPLSGSEQLHAMQMEARVTHRIVMRYLAGVTADMRLVWGTRYFNLRVILNVEERNRWYDIRADEGVAQ
jgi:SPP1 family predicted phage head-tail adaptor